MFAPGRLICVYNTEVYKNKNKTFLGIRYV